MKIKAPIIKYLLPAFLLLTVLNVSAQNKNRGAIDSLLRQATVAKEDTNKVHLLLKLGDAWYALKQVDSAVYWCRRALQLSEKLKWETGVIKAWRAPGDYYYRLGNYAKAQTYLDKAFQLAVTGNDDYITLETLTDAAATIYYQNKFNATIGYLQAAAGIFKKNGKTTLEQQAYVDIGIYYQIRYNYGAADDYYNKALALAQMAHARYPSSYVVSHIARFYQTLHGAGKAIAFLLKAATIYEQEGEQFDTANNYDTLGDIAEDEHDYNGAKIYYDKALLIAKKINNAHLLALTENSIAWVYYLNKDYDKAYTHCKQSMVYAKADSGMLLGDEGELGSIYRDAPDSVLAKAGVKPGQRYETSAALLTKWINYAKKRFEIQATTDGLKELSLTYEKMGHYADAFKTYRDYITKKDSVESLKDEKNVLLKQARAGYMHKEDSLNYAQRITSDELQQKKQQGYLFMGGIVLLLAVSVFIWLSYRNQRKSNHLLANANGQITTQRDQLSDALSNLKATQTQLIQSEKMASLGELTAGIAHEIQNPLNFVNNFSEVNIELIDEMETELENGTKKEVIEILEDIKQNLQKISHHGKRADGIVKGMLQHSRASSNTKEPTDINKLADEYLRLAYHGLRAKDKTFNAELIVNFADGLPTVNTVPQDVGRVLLNLFTNAFYAVHQKQKTGATSYMPMVTLSTARDGKNIEIRVRDNGGGIPENIRDKIMQPFYTTKPTGEGTGLGLSMSHEIVKAHGGSIEVESVEGEYTEFIVKLPV
jgi:two-component system NtrC family sensor kinase